MYYEDVVADADKELRRITDMFGLAFNKPNTNLKRQNPEPLCILISKFDELKAAFVGTEWEYCFAGND